MTLTSPAPPAPDVDPRVPATPLPTRRVVRPWLPQPAPPSAAAPATPLASGAVVSVAEPAQASFWARRAVWLGLLALAVGGIGEALLDASGQAVPGVVLLGLGMVLAALAWSGIPERPLLAVAGVARAGPIAWRRGLVLRLAGIVAAAALDGEAVIAYQAAPNEIFGLQGWLWLASMGLLLLSCARWYPRGQREADLGLAWSRGEAGVFLGLVALSLVTHLAFLDAIPWRFHFDEGFAFTETMRYYNTPNLPLFTTTWHDTSLPSLWFAFAAGLMHVTGISLAGVRLGVALIGALLVIPVYGIARLTWGRLAAGIAGFMVAVSAAAIHYSRVSILNITTGSWWAVCFYFLLSGLRSRRPGDFVWAGLAAGTSMYTYYGTRLLPILLLVFVAYLAIVHFRAARERLGHFALLVVGFFAGFGPLLGYFLDNPNMWVSRAGFFLNVPPSIPTTWDALVHDWNILAPLAWLDFLGFSVLPGRDTVYYTPLLLPAEGLLLFLGVAVLIWRWRQPAAFLLLLSGVGVLLSGGLLLDSSTIPNFAHWTPVFGVFYLALALPLALLVGALRQSSQFSIPNSQFRISHPLRLVAVVLLVVVLGADALANAYGYLVTYPPLVPADHSLEALQGRFIEAQAPGTHVYIVGPTWQLLYPDVAAMMGPHVLATNLAPLNQALPIVGNPAAPLAFVFYHDQDAALPVVQSFYPGGVTTPLRTPDGNQVATAYTVPAAQARRAYGVTVSVQTLGAVLPSVQVPTIGALPPGGAPSYPAQVTWSGAFYLDQGSDVHIRVDGGQDVQVQVEGATVTPATLLTFGGGWIPFQVQARLPNRTPIRFLVQQNTGPFQEPDTLHLWPRAPQP